MKGLVRHLFAVAVLPLMMAVVIPVAIASADLARAFPPPAGFGLIGWIGGVALLAIGLVLFVTSLRRFAVDGEGTLAPWDPPRRLVLGGPYRYVRNPMISGVIMVLFGEAALASSTALLYWAATFSAVNAVYIPLVEEPQLVDRFGASYEAYRKHVPRLIPRPRPWDGRGS